MFVRAQAAFAENGPFEVVENENAAEEDRYVLKVTQYGWDTVGHLLYVDQPVNTGFSFTSDSSDEARDEETVSNDMFEFLQDFFLSRPELADNPLFITGESYAGHYVPAVAHRAFVASKKDEGSVNLNLKGFAIGNGLTDPEVQYAAYAKYSVGIGIVSAEQGDMVNAKYLETCEKKRKNVTTRVNDTQTRRYRGNAWKLWSIVKTFQTICSKLRLKTKVGNRLMSTTFEKNAWAIYATISRRLGNFSIKNRLERHSASAIGSGRRVTWKFTKR